MSNEITVSESPRAGYGPAMRSCNDRQRRFVISLLETGSDNYTLAARMAGYSGTNNTMSVTAYRLSHDPKIQAAIQEEAKRRLNAGLILATSTLVQHVKNLDAKVSLKAIEMILNRGGLHAQSEHKVTVEHQMNEQETVNAIVMMANKMGVNPAQLLGEAGYKLPALTDQSNVVEGEYTEVATGELDYEGLEDCL